MRRCARACLPLMETGRREPPELLVIPCDSVCDLRNKLSNRGRRYAPPFDVALMQTPATGVRAQGCEGRAAGTAGEGPVQTCH